jgi:hypothetical protein
MNDYTTLIGNESKIRKEVYKNFENYNEIKDSIELDEINGISMIWRVYLYIVYLIDQLIPKDIALEILMIFATKEYDTNEKIIEKLKSLLKKLTNNEYTNLKMLIGHIYRIGCFSKKNIFFGLSFIFGNYIFRKAWESFNNSDILLSFLESVQEKKNPPKKRRDTITNKYYSGFKFKNMMDNNIKENEILQKENDKNDNDHFHNDDNKNKNNNINTNNKEVNANDNDENKKEEHKLIMDENYENSLAIKDPLCTDAAEFLYFFAKLDPIRLYLIIYLRVIILDFPSNVFYFFLNNFETIFSWTYAQTINKIQILKV